MLNEGNILPSILFGAHDFIRTSDSKSSYNTATYIAVTKNFNILKNKIDFKISAGTGSDYSLLLHISLKVGSTDYHLSFMI